MNRITLIEEIVRKECERYELEKGGFITNCEEVILTLAKSPYAELKEQCSLAEFKEWKEKLLIHLYTQRNYARYFYRKQGSRYLYLLTQRLMRNLATNLFQTNRSKTIDHELHVSRQRTVAFKLSNRLFADIYPTLWDKASLITTPSQIETQCEVSAHELFPIELPRFIDRLRRNDQEFWNEIVKVIKTIGRYVTINQAWVNHNIEEMADEVSMETALSLQEQICNNKLEHLTSATHLYHSLKTTCRNKLHEYFRAQSKQKEEMISEKEWEQLEATTHDQSDGGNRNEDDHFVYLQEVNPNNSYELSCAIVDILCHDKGELYKQLTKGQEEKTEILMLHIYKQLSYDEIVRQLYPELSPNEQRKACDKLRQTASRAKKHLKERMKQLILEWKQKESITLTDVEYGKM